MKKMPLLAVPLLFAGHLPPAAAETPAATVATAPRVVLVRVVELKAIGPDGRTHTLYHDDHGVLAVSRDLGRVTEQVKAGTLPEGGYHTLSVRLADQVVALHADGRREPRSLAGAGLAAEQRIRGMLWIEGGQVRAMDTRPHVDLGHGRFEDDE